MIHITEKQLAKKLRLWRRRHGFTLRTASKMVGLSNPFLSQFENGKTGIGLDNARKLLKLIQKPWAKL